MLARSTLQELCPRCLMEFNFVAPTDLTGDEEKSFGGDPGRSFREGSPTPADIGSRFPHLEILECLGRGGMGIVYKARQTRLNRLVALKILAPEKERTAQFSERFSREALALARLNHPSIVAVYDFGEADGLYYLLMEYVDGLSLRHLLQAHKITPEEALAIVPKICEALQYAHERGVVHRDIKPENVLMDKGGQVKIADFGVAKMVGGNEDGRALTQDRQVVGTPHYMAPEQVEHPERVDHRADIYSLGVVFYEMLTGELPLGKFQPPSKRVQGDVRLDDVVLHALEKEPERRYQQASQVKNDVETIATTPSQSPCEAAPSPADVLPGTGSIRPVRNTGMKSAWLTATRWTARTTGALLVTILVVLLTAHGLPPLHGQPVGMQLTFLAWLLVMLGCVVGWKLEGTAALLIGLGWSLFPIADGHLRLSLLWHSRPLPFLVILAALYALCWWATPRRKTWTAAGAAGAVLAVLVLSFVMAPAFTVRTRIPAREPQAAQNLIDLTPHYNAALSVNWMDPRDPQDTLEELPMGVQRLAGTEFDVRGLIQVEQACRVHPPQVGGIAIGHVCRELHFLHAARNAALIGDGLEIGRYVVHFANGEHREVPLVLGRDLVDWETQPRSAEAYVTAWTGQNPKSRRLGRTIRLFKSTWQNPLPEISIESVDFLALRPGPGPFLVALTVK